MTNYELEVALGFTFVIWPFSAALLMALLPDDNSKVYAVLWPLLLPLVPFAVTVWLAARIGTWCAQKVKQLRNRMVRQ